eukprot:2355902-Amphidinium_carterae.1
MDSMHFKQHDDVLRIVFHILNRKSSCIKMFSEFPDHYVIPSESTHAYVASHITSSTASVKTVW